MTEPGLGHSENLRGRVITNVRPASVVTKRRRRLPVDGIVVDTVLAAEVSSLMGFYEDRVLPRVIDVALGRPFEDTRRRVSSRLSGDVLEVGFGSGRNVPHYPAAVKRVQAVDPSSGGRRLAARRLAASPVSVEFVGLDGQDLPVEDDSVDHVLVTWTLCTIPDVDRALHEMRRVLKPGGGLHFVEHGRSPRHSTARWQDRVDPWWGKVFGGCHLTRSVPDLITDAGLRLETLDSYKAMGPELNSRFYEGVAVKD